MKKRILLAFDIGLSHGGVQSVIMSIVRSLSDQYVFDILVNTSKKQYFDDEFLSYGGKILRIPFYEGNSRFRTRADYYIRGMSLYLKTLKIIRDNMPYYAIHCHSVYETGLVVKAAARLRIPVRIAHSHAIPCEEPWIRSKINNLYLELMRKNSNIFIGCSNEACAALFGNKVSYRTVPNAFDDNRFRFSSKEYDNKNEISLIQVGRFDKNKNQKFSVDILSALIKKGVNARLCFVGAAGDSEEDNLRMYIKERKLEHYIDIYRTNADIPALLSNAHYFLLPSISEGFGTVLIEAQAVGLKCFVSDTVPQTTNCGGCVYVSLKQSSEKWADIVIDDFQKTYGLHKKYDCSRYCRESVRHSYEKIYGGEVK